MDLLDVLLLFFIELTVVKGLFLEVTDFRLQVHYLLVLLHFKLLLVYLVLENFELSHDFAHVPTVDGQVVLLRVRANLLK